MCKKLNKRFFAGVGLLAGFVLWTVLLCCVDRSPVGPWDSVVGFASFNDFIHRLVGVDMTLYNLTDWLGLVPIGFAVLFGIMGLVQWIKRRNIKMVDRELRLLGVFYTAVFVLYVAFEELALNYRPVLIDGVLEASYPSSTTLLVMCVMPTVVVRLKACVKSDAVKKCVCFAVTAFSLFMVIGRVLSGVHWITDIIGSVLLSGGLVNVYCSICKNSFI